MMAEKAATRATGWNLDNSYARLPDLFFTRQGPTPVRLPQLIIFNDSLAKSLGLNAQALQSQGAAVIVEDDALSTQLAPTVSGMLNDRAKLDAMEAAARKMAVPDAAERIVLELERLSA